MRRFRTYRNYSIGCFVVWGVLLAIVAATQTAQTRNRMLIVFGGWLIGWTSASVARLVYPPPKPCRRAT